MTRAPWTLCALLAALLALAGCDRAASSDTGKPRVVATTTMIGDLVRQIGQADVQLTVIMGPSVDPHSYKPSPADFEAILRAAVVFYNGLHLEGRMVDLFEGRLKNRAIPVTRDMPPSQLLSWKAGEAGAHDPHVWFDPRLWIVAARTVGAELSRIDSPNAAKYAQRTDDLVAQMQSLHDDLIKQVATVPPGRRVLITSHDAFNYFGRTYGFEVRGLQGISTETEAGLLAIQAAVDYIVKQKIPSIFVESSVSTKTIERVRDDCRSRGVPVTIGGELFSDAMGIPGQHPPFPVETWLGMMRYNVHTIVTALSASRNP